MNEYVNLREILEFSRDYLTISGIIAIMINIIFLFKKYHGIEKALAWFMREYRNIDIDRDDIIAQGGNYAPTLAHYVENYIWLNSLKKENLVVKIKRPIIDVLHDWTNKQLNKSVAYQSIILVIFINFFPLFLSIILMYFYVKFDLPKESTQLIPPKTSVLTTNLNISMSMMLSINLGFSIFSAFYYWVVKWYFINIKQYAKDVGDNLFSFFAVGNAVEIINTKNNVGNDVQNQEIFIKVSNLLDNSSKIIASQTEIWKNISLEMIDNVKSAIEDMNISMQNLQENFVKQSSEEQIKMQLTMINNFIERQKEIMDKHNDMLNKIEKIMPEMFEKYVDTLKTSNNELLNSWENMSTEVGKTVENLRKINK